MAGIKREPPRVRDHAPKRRKVSNGSTSRGVKNLPTTRVQKLPTPADTSASEAGSDIESEDDVEPQAGGKASVAEKKKAVKDTAAAAYANQNGMCWRLPRSDPCLSTAGTSSRESHIKQKALAQERKAAKPNADSISRSKKLWERLRRKSHVPKQERDELVAELFEITSGKVKDFVFKHDSVRIIQTAIKYATPAQKRQIAKELKGSYRELAESKYAKFLIAKLIVDDDEIRDIIVPEFYGHVKRLIRHPEASWIVDDIYRTLATTEQKANLLREWYGPEFVIFKSTSGTADLQKILEENPEKRGSIMQQLKELTNQLVQKKTTGFTMLHDALLQYFLNCKPGSPEANEFLEMLKDDEEGDCFKNLAFTNSGARLVCLALAYGSSKDRRTTLKVFKGVMNMLAADANGHLVLLAAYDVIDDTVMSSKAIFPELLGKDQEVEARNAALILCLESNIARIPYLYLLNIKSPAWLLPDYDASVITEVKNIRKETSKKGSETRRMELVKAVSQPLIDLVTANMEALAASSYGSQAIAEILFGCDGEKVAALDSLASLAGEKPAIFDAPAAGRMLKSLVQGGRFDKKRKSVIPVEPALRFAPILYKQIQPTILEWATGARSFVVVALLETEDFKSKKQLSKELSINKKTLEKASKGSSDQDKGNAGAKILLTTLK